MVKRVGSVKLSYEKVERSEAGGVLSGESDEDLYLYGAVVARDEELVR